MVSQRWQSNQTSHRDAWVEVDLAYLEKNVQRIRSWLLDGCPTGHRVKLMGVVKGDAYGHGAVAVSQVLAASGADWLAVASVDEGCQLREAGIKLPILVLGPTPSWAIAKALDYELDLAITSANQLQAFIAQTKDGDGLARIHIKVDTGMHRLGFQQEAIVDLIKSLKAHPQLQLISVFSHLAQGDDLTATRAQNDKFQIILKIFQEADCLPEFVHLAASESARRFPFTRYDLVRIGINLFGLESKQVPSDLIPILTLRGRINQLSTIDQGESVGYGLTWQAHRQTKLAVIPIGYADGIDRGLSNRMRGLLAGVVVKQVGTISMDQMTFDVTDVPAVQEGDVITLIGAELAGNRNELRLTLAEWAQALDTITYELASRMRVRLPRIYTRRGSARFPQSLKGG